MPVAAAAVEGVAAHTTVGAGAYIPVVAAANVVAVNVAAVHGGVVRVVAVVVVVHVVAVQVTVAAAVTGARQLAVQVLVVGQ